MTPKHLNDQQLEAYHRDGFVIVRSLYNSEETKLLQETSGADRGLYDGANDMLDRQGGVSKICLWNHPGDDLYGMFSRGRRVVDSMEKLLGGEVYHFHSKMMMKEPYVGGAWEWHQDYGYWYKFQHCLYPYLASCMISVNAAMKENGCLQVLKGSHHMGRIEHGTAAGQIGADLERVEEAMKRLELVYVEMSPGDAVFFHCNLLHRSDQNRSAHPRWTLICCYNAARNNPFKEGGGHPSYTPLHKVEDDAILKMGATIRKNGGAVTPEKQGLVPSR